MTLPSFSPALAGGLLLAATLLRAGEPVPAPPITSAELLAHVQRLASDEWEGRGSGTEGERHATEYVARVLASLGLVPAGEDETFFQPVEMPAGYAVDPASTLAVPGADEPLALDADWRPFSLSSSGKAEGELVFAGYGITAPEQGYDDYAGLDVRGKVVVVFRHLPRGGAWDGPQARGRHAPFVAKLARAVEQGAIGLVVANDPHHFAPREGRARADVPEKSDLGAGEPRIPFAHLTLAAARRLFPRAFGATPEELEAAIHRGEAPAPSSRAGRLRARLAVGIERKTIVGRNVCALLPAGAPDAPDEVVIVGAHHDHLGRGGRGSLARTTEERAEIHNGADDNASGTAGLLEVAAWLAPRRAELRRSVLFLTFTGEERGLLGSRHFVEHPTVPLAKVAAMLNMDMIGRLEGRKLFVGGVKTSPVFEPLLAAKAKEAEVDVLFGDGGRAPSDNMSFYLKELPVLFFFSGMHRDYHRPSDDADRIDPSGMEKAARLCALVVEDLARRPDRPAFQRADRGGAGPPRPVLGIGAAPADGGVRVTQLLPEGPAAVAGLLVDDVITAVAGGPVADLAALVDALGKREIGAPVTVTVRRGEETLDLEVTLGRG